jgi:hypothetical protein
LFFSLIFLLTVGFSRRMIINDLHGKKSLRCEY